MALVVMRCVLWHCTRCGHKWPGVDRDVPAKNPLLRRPICCLNCGDGDHYELVLRHFLCPKEHLTETRDGGQPPHCASCGSTDIAEMSVKGS